MLGDSLKSLYKWEILQYGTLENYIFYSLFIDAVNNIKYNLKK